jgi:YHS domain-containing protein
MATDPVCKMTVDPDKAAARVEYQGATYYFCSQACHQQFTAHPKKYAAHKPGGGHGGHAHGPGG